MSDQDECPHGMGDPAWCSVCKHGPTRLEVQPYGYPFPSRYDGHCAECHLPIYPPELIASRVSIDGYVRYCHAGCRP